MNVEAKQQLHACLMRTREAVVWKTNPPLQATWSDAFNDEPPKSKTQLLFRVDADIRLRDARTFQGFCKGGKCAPPAGVTCLHLTNYTDPSPDVHDFVRRS